jgi:site-specific DNA recombinase
MPRKQHTTEQQPPLRYAIYCRFSHKVQNEISLESQELMCRREIEARGGTVVRVYADSAKLGWSLDREEFNQMRDDAKKGKFDAIMMWKLDRLARDHTQATMIKALLRHEYKIKLHCVEGYSEDDDDSPYTAMMEQFLSVFAAFYSRNLSSEVKRANQHRHANGKFNGGLPPLGYYMLTEKKPKHRRCFQAQPGQEPGLYIHPREAAIVRRAFKMYAEGGHTFKSITAYLNSKRKHFNVDNDDVFCIDTARKMLQNRIYLGEVSYAEHLYKGNFRQQRVTSRHREEWTKGIHCAILTEELFDRVQAVIAKNGKQPINPRKVVPYLLSGKLYCAHCLENRPPGIRDPKYGIMWGKRKTWRGKQTQQYFCSCEERGYPKCKQGIYVADDINQQVIDVLFDLESRLPSNVQAAVINIVKNKLDGEAAVRRMEEIQQIVERIDMSWEQGFMDQETYFAKRRALQNEIENLRPVEYDQLLEAARTLKDFKSLWQITQTDEERQQLVNRVLEYAVIKDRTIIAVVLSGNISLLIDENGGQSLDVRGFEPLTSTVRL